MKMNPLKNFNTKKLYRLPSPNIHSNSLYKKEEVFHKKDFKFFRKKTFEPKRTLIDPKSKSTEPLPRPKTDKS